MRYYAHYGHKDFILCLGYRGDLIRQFFIDYDECLSNDFTYSKGGACIEPHRTDIHDWRITFVDTGMHANIAERLSRSESSSSTSRCSWPTMQTAFPTSRSTG